MDDSIQCENGGYADFKAVFFFFSFKTVFCETKEILRVFTAWSVDRREFKS
jgi:hypothetical protein